MKPMEPPRDLLERVSVNPSVCLGKPCIRGTRIWVSFILELLASGASEPDILSRYPQLESDDVRAALTYGARMSQEYYVELPTPG